MNLRIGRIAFEPEVIVQIDEVGLVGLQEHFSLFGPEIAGGDPQGACALFKSLKINGSETLR